MVQIWILKSKQTTEWGLEFNRWRYPLILVTVVLVLLLDLWDLEYFIVNYQYNEYTSTNCWDVRKMIINHLCNFHMTSYLPFLTL